MMQSHRKSKPPPEMRTPATMGTVTGGVGGQAICGDRDEEYRTQPQDATGFRTYRVDSSLMVEVLAWSA